MIRKIELSPFVLLLVIFLTNNVFGQTQDNLPLKLKVGTFNVGHFNQGDLGGFQMTGNKAKAELNNWKYWIGGQSLDVFVVNEWNLFFDKDSTYNSQNELLASFYSYIYFGEQNKWIYNGIATNYELRNIRQKNLSADYYALVGDLEVGKETIHIVSVHVPWQKQWHGVSRDSLINILKGYKYFICMGDMNAFDDSQKQFLKAGFNMANGGSLGWFPTAAGRVSSSGLGGAPNDNIDNIVTSPNIKIFNVNAPKTGLNDLDHRPIMADVMITW